MPWAKAAAKASGFGALGGSGIELSPSLIQAPSAGELKLGPLDAGACARRVPLGMAGFCAKLGGWPQQSRAELNSVAIAIANLATNLTVISPCSHRLLRM